MRSSKPRRTGVAAVEFALVAPILITLVLGMIEVGRAVMVQQLLVNATREGARAAVLETATVSSVKTYVQDYLSGMSIAITSDKIAVQPDPVTATSNTPISVSVSVPYSDVNWLPVPKFVSGNLQASTSMRLERMD